jgi:hypothetical protein
MIPSKILKSAFKAFRNNDFCLNFAIKEKPQVLSLWFFNLEHKARPPSPKGFRLRQGFRRRQRLWSDKMASQGAQDTRKGGPGRCLP